MQAGRERDRGTQTDQRSTSWPSNLLLKSHVVHLMFINWVLCWVSDFSLSPLFRNSQNKMQTTLQFLIKNTHKNYFNTFWKFCRNRVHFFPWISPAHRTDKISCLRLSKHFQVCTRHFFLKCFFPSVRFQFRMEENFVIKFAWIYPHVPERLRKKETINFMAIH